MQLADAPLHLWTSVIVPIEVYSLGDPTLIFKLDHSFDMNDACATRFIIHLVASMRAGSTFIS